MSGVDPYVERCGSRSKEPSNEEWNWWCTCPPSFICQHALGGVVEGPLWGIMKGLVRFLGHVFSVKLRNVGIVHKRFCMENYRLELSNLFVNETRGPRLWHLARAYTCECLQPHFMLSQLRPSLLYDMHRGRVLWWGEVRPSSKCPFKWQFECLSNSFCWWCGSSGNLVSS